MTLEQLQRAIRPQFFWIETAYRKPRTAEKAERYAGFGPMVFIGISHSFNIPKAEVLDYLEIKTPEYNHKLEDFMHYVDEIKKRKERGTLLQSQDFIRRVYLKTTLTLNAIQFQNPGLQIDDIL